MMFIAAVLTGSILGYAAAGLALIFGLPFSMAFLALISVGMLGTLTTVGLSLLQNPDYLEEELALAV